MINTKKAPWTVVAILFAASVFGQEVAANPKSCKTPCPKPDCAPKCCPTPCPQPCPPTQLCPPPCPDPCCPPWPVPVLNAAYSYPARIITRCPWDIYFDASFIYWQPSQDNMELGTIDTVAPGGLNHSDVATMNFNYKPGFKVGLGGNFDYDNWDAHAEYTWFHNTNHRSVTAGTGQVLSPMWGHPSFIGGTTYASGSERWNLRMDILDVDLGRWYYVGTKLTWRPDFGMRAAWIRQNVETTYTSTLDVAEIQNRSSSWAVGPKVGLCTNWMVGWGFRFFGNTEADLLFTKYTKIMNKETHTLGALGDFSSSEKRINTLKAHFDLEVGLGWGTYWDCNNWHTDVALGYEFQAFFDQNMFRHYCDDVMSSNSFVPNGNLYTQGLTATFRLDF